VKPRQNKPDQINSLKKKRVPFRKTLYITAGKKKRFFEVVKKQRCKEKETQEGHEE
jgi:hypothetical protein